jgi:hypothetical protein
MSHFDASEIVENFTFHQRMILDIALFRYYLFSISIIKFYITSDIQFHFLFL